MAPTHHEEPHLPTWRATLDDLATIRRDVIEDRITFGRRRRQLEIMLADVAEIRNALNYYAEERPA